MKKSDTFVSFFFYLLVLIFYTIILYCQNFLVSGSLVVLSNSNCIADTLTTLCWNRGNLSSRPVPQSKTPSVKAPLQASGILLNQSLLRQIDFLSKTNLTPKSDSESYFTCCCIEKSQPSFYFNTGQSVPASELSVS